MKYLAFLMSLCLAWPASAQDVKLDLKGDGIRVVEIDKVITVKVKVTVIDAPFFVVAPPGGLTYTWKVPPGVAFEDKDDSLFVTSAPKGDVTISVRIVNVDWEAKKVSRVNGTITFAVGDPGPGPTPPGPIGQPLGVPGFAVMIVYDKDNVPAGQQAVIFGQAVRNYLNAKCGKAADGSPNRRIYPFGVDASAAEQWIRDAIQRHPGQKSWMVVSDGKNAYDGPIPATVDAAMAIFKQYAEPPQRTLYNFPIVMPGEVVPFLPAKEDVPPIPIGFLQIREIRGAR